MFIKHVLIALSIAVFFQSGTGYKVETRYHVPGNGGFDYVTMLDVSTYPTARKST